jgi:site-specific DNA-cytosine methylase
MAKPTGLRKAVELCSGFIGGWSVAMRQSASDIESVAGVDVDNEAVANFALNHGFQMITDDQLGNMTEANKVAIHADLTGLKWADVFRLHDAQIWTVSAPWQSWSSMGHQRGSMSKDGQVLVSIMKHAKLLQPALIVFEQVAGFRRSEEFEEWRASVQDAGFEIAYAAIIDVSFASRTTRRRYLAVLVNRLHISQWDKLGKYMRVDQSGEHLFDAQKHCCRMWSQSQWEELVVGEEEMQRMEDPRYFPDWVKKSAEGKFTGMGSRVVSSGGRLPTMTASYRAAIHFDKSYLEQKGLMTWVVRDYNNRIRWFSKWEAALAMGMPHDLVLLNTEEMGWKAVGNAISPYRAVVVLNFAAKTIH